ncbi:hypothetical protein EF847_01620 [Actinobacteria bacterium YIM 96077]|uniref:Major capsid protein n=1 Tax=Phytoactinopolyspora halophila TaxID=1981511 RepID=A0A329QFR0_9ACTN|nr:hypothetical protein EF847_01620 [Actinobacteria bacterium YIM 96077]RAW11164.1 hypothetical protein DPM12_17645 [Phytoactinopolyspora halophila]
MSPTNNANVGYIPVQAYEDVAEDRHVLDEVVAVDQQQAKPLYYVRIRVTEHGKRIGRTKLLRDSAYIPVDEQLVQKMTVHAADTMDALAADQLYDGRQWRSSGHSPEVDGYSVTDTEQPFNQVVGVTTGGLVNDSYDPDVNRTDITSDHTLTSRVSARIVARLRDASAMPWQGTDFVGIMSNDTAIDFQEDTGVLGWSEPHKRVDTTPIYAGSVGRYRGVEWIVHPRARKLEGAGSGGANVHQTLIFGRDVLAEWTKDEVRAGLEPEFDPWRRHIGLTWYYQGGFAIFRQEPLWRIEHGSAEN